MGFEQSAQEIVTLDDAWAALTVTGSKLIQSILVPITPIIITVVEMITWWVESITISMDQACPIGLKQQ